jgi:hypothetical protein
MNYDTPRSRRKAYQRCIFRLPIDIGAPPMFFKPRVLPADSLFATNQAVTVFLGHPIRGTMFL